jgi:hypothetical protein
MVVEQTPVRRIGSRSGRCAGVVPGHGHVQSPRRSREARAQADRRRHLRRHVAFSVAPSISDNGCFVPSMSGELLSATTPTAIGTLAVTTAADLLDADAATVYSRADAETLEVLHARRRGVVRPSIPAAPLLPLTFRCGRCIPAVGPWLTAGLWPRSPCGHDRGAARSGHPVSL